MSAQPRRRTQAERKAESERKIISAAVELFASQGYVRTTLNQVGSRAGYTGGLISSRFGSKENLLKAVLKHISDGFLLGRAQGVIDPKDTAASLHGFVNIYLTDVASKKSSVRSLYVLMGEALGAISDVQEEVAAFNRLTRKRLAEIVQNGIELGQVPADVDADSASVMILSLIRGVTMQYLADPGNMKPQELADSVNEVIDAYLHIQPERSLWH